MCPTGCLRRWKLLAFLVEGKEEKHSKKECNLEEASTKGILWYFKLSSVFQSPWCLSLSQRTLMSLIAVSSRGSECFAGGNKVPLLPDAGRLLFHLWTSPPVAGPSCKMTFPGVLAPRQCQSPHLIPPGWSQHDLQFPKLTFVLVSTGFLPASSLGAVYVWWPHGPQRPPKPCRGPSPE